MAGSQIAQVGLELRVVLNSWSTFLYFQSARTQIHFPDLTLRVGIRDAHPGVRMGAAPLGCELGALLLGNRGFLIRSHSIPPSQLQPHYKMVTILLLIKEVTRYKCVHKLSAKSWCIVVNLEKKRIFFSMVLGVEPRLLSMASKYYHWAIQLNRGL